MSREKPRRRIRNFLKEGLGWSRELSRAAGHRVAYIHGQIFEPWREVDMTDNPQIGARNRSGERRRTNKRLKDI
jgi:hypothetical protein